jgi:hypothetical protein
MKYTLLSVYLLLTIICYGQYPQFSGGDWGVAFSKGSVVLNDGTERKGYLQTLGSQKKNLLFRASTEYGVRDTTVYKISEVKSFRMYPNYYQRMNDVKLYAHEWQKSGKLTHCKEIFAQVLNTGAINVYAFRYEGLDPLTDVFLHCCFIFEKKTATGTQIVPFPINPRYTEANFDKTKPAVIKFFEGYPQIQQTIRELTTKTKLHDLIQLIREIE